MKNSVYLLSGKGLPTKLAVVGLGLEHDTLLDIENRFLRGAKYTTLTLVAAGVIKLAEPRFGPHDQAYFPGRDTSRLEPAGASVEALAKSMEPGEVLTLESVDESSRRAYLLEHTHASGTEHMVVVLADSEGLCAEAVTQSFAHGTGAGTLVAQYIGSGSFLVAPEIAQAGFKVHLAPAVVLES